MHYNFCQCLLAMPQNCHTSLLGTTCKWYVHSLHVSSQGPSTMVVHKAFENAGKTPGLQIWRVEKMDLVVVPSELHGQFFTGDSYVVLCTITPSSLRIHSWTGKEASQDERGAVAIFMTQLDDFLQGIPQQFTEFQNEESSTFLSYFPKGIVYKAGGVASGFKHVVTNAVDRQRVLLVKGRHAIRAKEVSVSWSSFNKGDCFIIDLGKNIYHWSGSNCNFWERIKATELAIGIRDNEGTGSCQLHMIDEGSEPEEVLKVLGPRPAVLPESSVDDVEHEQRIPEAVLYKISDAAGSMTETKVADKTPFQQSLLSEEDCYILDNKGHNLFVWKGRKANAEERKSALNIARQFITRHSYPDNTKIEIFPSQSETTLFKDFFFNWLDKDETTGPTKPYTIGSIAKVEQIPFDASSLHSNQAMAAHHGMVDDGSGKVQIWRVEGNDKAEVDQAKYGQFFGGDCYLIQYSYDSQGREKHIIYIWQGRKSTIDERAASAILTVALDDSMGGVATQVRVTQGQEPPHLVSMFKQKTMIIHMGGTSRSGDETQPGSTRLFHIRISTTKATRAVEVEPIASSLNTNDVFVLKTPNSVFEWKGLGANEEEIKAATELVRELYPTDTVTKVDEKMESADFWSALGGKGEYQTSRALQTAIKNARLFSCSNKTGRLIAEEVPGDLTQMNLAPDDIMILDTWNEIYIWVGKDANEVEKSGASKIAEDYVNTHPSGRSGTPLVTIKQGEEPPSFTGWFHGWDPKMWDNVLAKLKG
uniref:Gelsolin-like n=2 Tax=Sphaeramia orbicularis TaxID=375764 RepID=A0A673B702_9TELE